MEPRSTAPSRTWYAATACSTVANRTNLEGRTRHYTNHFMHDFKRCNKEAEAAPATAAKVNITDLQQSQSPTTFVQTEMTGNDHNIALSALILQ